MEAPQKLGSEGVVASECEWQRGQESGLTSKANTVLHPVQSQPHRWITGELPLNDT